MSAPLYTTRKVIKNTGETFFRAYFGKVCLGESPSESVCNSTIKEHFTANNAEIETITACWDIIEGRFGAYL